MLASTVQFSRNGRAQVTIPLREWISWSASKVLLSQPTLQGPTACLGITPWVRGSTPPASRRLY